MIAELKVYGDPSSLEPTKTYPVYRITPHTMGLVQDFIFKRFSEEEVANNNKEIVEEKYAKYSTDEMVEEAARLLRIFFPQITEEEIWMLDYGDGTGKDGQFYEFLNAISDYANKESNRSLKN